MIAIVIPVRDGSKTLAACLDALAVQTVPLSRLEIVVVDDGSRDQTAQLAARYGFCRVVSQPPRGAAAARNRGLEETRGEWVAFLDADCRPVPDWLERLTAPFSDPRVQGVVGRFVSSQRRWVSRLVQIDLDLRYERMAAAGSLDFVNTATCVFRREALGRKPFDEGFAKLEDLDFSFRLASQGVRIAFAPDAVVEHRHPESMGHFLGRRFQYGRYAPELYRRHKARMAADSSTPQSRRMQLILLALGMAALPIYWPVGLLGLAGSALFSLPLLSRAVRISPWLGLLAFPYLWGGNLAFVAGFLSGFPILGRLRPQ